jgi:hypothetical protein
MRKTGINQRGAIFALALIALTIILVITVILASNSLTYKQNSRYSLDNLEASALAEAGIDKAVASLNESGGTYNGESETEVGPGSFSVMITDIDQSTRKVESTGYYPNKQNPKSTKTVSIVIAKGAGLSFNYGIQAGEGGFELRGGSKINGSVYSNGNILMTGGPTITGDVHIAGGTQPLPDQNAECDGSNCSDYQFGKSISGQNRLDIAQSFRPQTLQASSLNKISLKLKKYGSPPNLTVRIMGDNSGRPNKNNVIATGTLASSLVTQEYGFADITFTASPVLQPNTPYWMVLDTSLNNNNYWSWQLDSLGGYTRGSASWSPDWDAGNPSWTSIGGDLSFKTFMGGTATKIEGSGGSVVQGSVYANTLMANSVAGLSIAGHAHYQSVDPNVRVHGNSCYSTPVNSYCHPNSTDPAPRPLPISEANIAEWEALANANGVINGNQTLGWNCNQVWGTFPNKKINGNVTVTSSCNIKFKSPVHITGNLIVDSGARVGLDESYGEQSGVIVVDGRVIISGAGAINGTSSASSNMLVLSKYLSPGPNFLPAIDAGGGTSSSILYAGGGNILMTGAAHLNQITAKKVILDGGAVIDYDSGVTSPFFSSGPSGSFTVIKGTYQQR